MWYSYRDVRVKSHIVSKNAPTALVMRSMRSGKSIYAYKYYIYRYLSSRVGIALSPTHVAHVD